MPYRKYLYLGILSFIMGCGSTLEVVARPEEIYIQYTFAIVIIIGASIVFYFLNDRHDEK